MDTLELRMGVSEEGVDIVDVFVNGRNLVDLLKEVEAPFAEEEGSPEIAGSYKGFYPDEVFLPSRLFLGEPSGPYSGRDDKVPVLECECGTPGCWDFLVRIRVLADQVRWSDYEQPHRTSDSGVRWIYDDLPDFVFNRRQYESELSKDWRSELTG